MDDPNGPLPTWFSVELACEGAVGQGDVQECEPIVEYDPNFMLDLKYFEEDVYWWQTVDLSGASPNDSIRGFLSFMVCDDRQCLPPEDIPFALATFRRLGHRQAPLDVCPPSQHLCHPEQAEEGEEVVQEEEEEEGLVGTFLLGFLAGVGGAVHPLRLPHDSHDGQLFHEAVQKPGRRHQERLALRVFHHFHLHRTRAGLDRLFGVDVLNVISTDPLFNVFLFALLLVFGFSFLGAFEIQLPSSWANKADQASDRGGILGIFFMAATLAIVSFSCTGPLVGSALAGAATGSFAAPTAVMLGFSIALALPFGLFAVFPGWLNSLPQSGGWLNSVKVVLGLVEIGFAFKFLSNADLVLQLGLLPRELFIAIWVAVSLAIAFYLFGWFTLPHDSKVERLGVFRFSTGLVFMMFAVYLVPGMWGAPVNLISGFPLPCSTANGKVGVAVLKEDTLDTSRHALTTTTTGFGCASGGQTHAP